MFNKHNCLCILIMTRPVSTDQAITHKLSPAHLSALVVGGRLGQLDVGDVDRFGEVTRTLGGQPMRSFVTDGVSDGLDGCL